MPRYVAFLVWLLAAIGCFALVPSSSRAQSAGPARGVVVGHVSQRGDSASTTPAVGASVRVLGTARERSTDASGYFLIDSVPAGARAVRVRHVGYRMAEQTIRVPAGDTVHLTITLMPEAQLLGAVTSRVEPLDQEMFVSRPNVGALTIGATAMRGVPSVGEPDVVRIAQLLPGVVARNDFNIGLNVHGGEADQNLILLDGYPIYNPFHVGGLFSTFMDATVASIELESGAFPARYGGRLSSVLDVRSTDEARPGTHASVDLSALATSARVTGTLAGRGTWSFAARRTYADAFASTFSRNIFPYHFRDLHARASYLLPWNAHVTVTAYDGKDVLDANLAAFDADSSASRAAEGRWAFDWGNRVVGATLTQDLTERMTIEQRVSASGFRSHLDLGDGAKSQHSTVRDVRLAGSLLRRGGRHDVGVGYEAAWARIGYGSGSAQTTTSEFDLLETPVTTALWVDDLWRLSTRLLVQTGLRGDALRSGALEWAALSPRVSLKFFATPQLALTAAVGRATQTLHSMAGDGPLRYFDIWLASDEYTPVATAWHCVAGAERRLSVGSVRVEGFIKRYDRVLEANWSEDPSRRGDEFLVAQGLSYGGDLFARWQARSGTSSGWLAYTYGVSARWRDGERWAPGFDRRHDVNVVAMRRLAKYRVGARFGYASGTPYTPIVGEVARRVYDPARDTWATYSVPVLLESLGGGRNSARYPAMHRLDLEVSREFQRRRVSFAPYLSVVNAYNARNVFVYLYQYSIQPPTRRAISQFPLLPSGGMRVAF